MLKTGFTLVEVLIAIAIIGVITVGVVAFVNPLEHFNRAKTATTQTAMNQMATEIEGVRVIKNQTLFQTTNNGCTECACRCLDATSNTTCINAVTSSWAKISSKELPKDGWGNVLMFDENEGEFGPSDCRLDRLYSAGPDHIRGSGSCPAYSADDISIEIPTFLCQ